MKSVKAAKGPKRDNPKAAGWSAFKSKIGIRSVSATVGVRG